MKIALVYPRTKEFVFSSWAPRGLVSLATILRKRNYDVIVIDSSFDKDLQKTKSILRKIKPHIISVSLTFDLMNNAKSIINFAKKLNSITIAGGPYATLEPEKVASYIPELDYLVSGDSEEVFPKLLERLENKKRFTDIKGVYYKKNNTLKFTGETNFNQSLDGLPFPDYDMLPTAKKYFEFGTATIMGSLGCPYRCNFCQPTLSHLFGKKVRFRDQRNIIEELNYITGHYEINEIYFVDDTFGLQKKWLEKFVTLLEKSELNKIKFLINTRADVITEKIVLLLKRMNCSLISIGVESGSQQILDALDKDLKVEQITRAFSLCKKHNLRTHANLMVGNPGESKKTLHQTEMLLNKIKPDSLYLSFLNPYPGTYIYEQNLKNGKLNLQSYDDINCRKYDKPLIPLENSNLTYEYIDNFRKRIFRKRRPRAYFFYTSLILDDFLQSLQEKNLKLFLNKQILRAKLYIKTSAYFG